MKNCRNIPEEAKKEGEEQCRKAEVGKAEGEKQKWEGGELGTTGPRDHGGKAESRKRKWDHGPRDRTGR